MESVFAPGIHAPPTLTPPPALPPAPPPDPILNAMQDRVIRSGDQEFHYPFLVIDRPELWAEASKIRGEFRMPILGTGKSIRFPMKGPSLEDWEMIEAKHIVPIWEDDGDPTPDHEERRKKAIQERQIGILELCLDQKIPGASAEEKAQFLNQRSPGEAEALFQYIENTLCNWNDSPNVNLLVDYNRKLEQFNTEPVLEFTSFEDWKRANETQYIFRMQRPVDNYLIEIPLKGLTKDQKIEIEAATKDLPVPRVPMYVSSTKSFDRTRDRPNHQDPAWLKRQRTVIQQRTVMYFDACLPFSVPGSNIQEKYAWLGKRLVGDITKVKDFIEQELLTYGSRYNFFTRR